MKLSKEVLDFAYGIQAALDANAPEKGETWRKECSMTFLFNRLQEETAEVLDGKESLCREDMMEELSDVGAVCMMLWHRVNWGE